MRFLIALSGLLFSVCSLGQIVEPPLAPSQAVFNVPAPPPIASAVYRGPSRAGCSRKKATEDGYAYPVEINKTIYEALKDDADYSTVFKLIDSNPTIAKLLNDRSANITFFAPSNAAFSVPKYREGCRFCAFAYDDEVDLGGDRFLIDSAESAIQTLARMAQAPNSTQGDRKLREFLHGNMLAYHILPQPLALSSLVQNTTYGTQLLLPHGSSVEPLRLHFGREYQCSMVIVNQFSRIIAPQTNARNGFLYTINKPLIPPTSVFQELFGADMDFASVASAIQYAGLRDVLDDNIGTMGDASVVTFFAPDEMAFSALPTRLRIFLFSSSGRRALRKLLMLHIIPNTVLHSDYLHVTKLDETRVEVHKQFRQLERHHLIATRQRVDESLIRYAEPLEVLEGEPIVLNVDGPIEEIRAELDVLHAQCNGSLPRLRVVRVPQPMPRIQTKLGWDAVRHNDTINLPTLLPGHSLEVVRTMFENNEGTNHYRSTVRVNNVLSIAPDVIARNGAVHVINQLLHPFKKFGGYHHDNKEDGPQYLNKRTRWDDTDRVTEMWSDWEDWLYKWAEEDN